jgi:hypothetical protein
MKGGGESDMGQGRLSRRGLMRAAAGTAAGAGAAGALAPGAASAASGEGARRRRAPEDLVPRQNIGIQLYTLRDLLAADLPGTLDLLRDAGYPEVELFQLHGRPAPELRALLDERGCAPSPPTCRSPAGARSSTRCSLRPRRWA